MPRDAAHGRRACQPPGAAGQGVLEVGRLGQRRGAAASPSPRAQVRAPVRSRPNTRRPAPPPTCMRRCRSLHVAPPSLLPSRAFRLRASQGPLGGEVPAPKRGDAVGRRRRRGAHVPAEPWCVTHHAHLCDEGRVSILLHAVEYSVPNMNGECNVPRQSYVHVNGNGGTLRLASRGGVGCVASCRERFVCTYWAAVQNLWMGTHARRIS